MYFKCHLMYNEYEILIDWNWLISHLLFIQYSFLVQCKCSWLYQACSDECILSCACPWEIFLTSFYKSLLYIYIKLGQKKKIVHFFGYQTDPFFGADPIVSKRKIVSMKIFWIKSCLHGIKDMFRKRNENKRFASYLFFFVLFKLL